MIIKKLLIHKNLMCLFIFLTFIFSVITNAQDKTSQLWNGKKCAVALTYDDGLNVHLDKVIPVLDSLGFKATFYLHGTSKLGVRLNEWRALSNNGHELGNHTLFHPCIGKSRGFDWVSPDYDLDNYSIDRIVDEIKLANTLLNAVDNKTKRTFAYTCGDKTIKDSSFVNLIKNDFIGARGVTSGFNHINDIDFFDVKAFGIDGETADELIDIVNQAKAKNSLVVFLFHGVGGKHALNISLEEHNKFLQYIKDNEEYIWVSPLVEILEFIKNKPSSRNLNKK